MKENTESGSNYFLQDNNLKGFTLSDNQQILFWKLEPKENISFQELGESIDSLETCSTISEISSINSAELIDLENIFDISGNKEKTNITPPLKLEK